LTFDEVFAWVRDALHASLAGEKREHEAAIGWLRAEYESKLKGSLRANVVSFAPVSGHRRFVTACPLSADIVAEVCDFSSEAAGSISRNGSHHPLFAER
jgi:hypothetical protein